MMMKRSKTYGMTMTALLAALTLLTAAGCSDTFWEGHGRGAAISLTTALQADGQTRAATSIQTSQFDQGETFYAYFPGNVTPGSAVYQTKDAAGETVIAEGSSQPYFEGTANEATVHAYYPHGTKGETTVSVDHETATFSVQLDQSTDDNYKLSDLMYASATITNDRTYVTVTQNLQFQHRMAKIIVVAQAGEGVGKILNVRIIGGYRTVNIATPLTCTLGTTLSDALSTTTPLWMCRGNNTSSVSCAALLPPQTINGSFLLVQTDQGTVTYNLTNKPLASGSSYLFTMTVNKAAIGTTIGIGGWDASGNTTINPTVLYGGTFNISGDIDGYHEYTGDPITPAFTVIDQNRGAVSADNYEYVFYNNVNAGESMLFVQGKKGTEFENAYGFKQFAISQQDFSAEGTLATIANISSRTYNGNPQTPSLTIRDYNQKLLAANIDYELGYENNTNAGTATAMITGIGNYKGFLSTDFNIAKAASSMSFNPASFTFINDNLSNGSTKLTIIGDGALSISSNDTDIAAITSPTTIGAGDGREAQTVSFTTGTKTGIATITASMAEGNNYLTGSGAFTVKVMNSPKTLSSIEENDTQYVGHVVTSDGCVFEYVEDAENLGKTVVGMICYVGTAGSADASSGTYKGLVIGLSNAENQVQWRDVDEGTCVYQNPNFPPHYAYGDMKGIENTNQMANGTGPCEGHIHAAAQAAKNYAVERPEGCSQWFLPTSGQWLRFLHDALHLNFTGWAYCVQGQDGFAIVNNLFTSAGANPIQNQVFWTSSEARTSNAVYVQFLDLNERGVRFFNFGKSNKYAVRAFFAF